MKLHLKISLAGEDGRGFMGIGLLRLLRGIEEARSIRGAAAGMELSYAKAHFILKRLEQNLGRAVLVRCRGGSRRGGAELTEFGKFFLNEYARFQERTRRGAEREFSGFLVRLDRGRTPEEINRPSLGRGKGKKA